MDNSSRNIIKFIATLTIAALLIMAARYYAMSQDAEPQPAATADKAAPKPEVVGEEVPQDETSAADDEISDADTEIVIEELEPINGEPSASVPEN
jgi:hypothetical protein